MPCCAGPDRVTACSSVEGLDASSVATVLRAQRTSTLEARRVALTCVLFPGGRTAAADETTEEEGSFGPGAWSQFACCSNHGDCVPFFSAQV